MARDNPLSALCPSLLILLLRNTDTCSQSDRDQRTVIHPVLSNMSVLSGPVVDLGGWY